VGVVDHEAGGVAVGHLAQPRQGGHAAVHAEDAVRDDELAPGPTTLACEEAVEVGDVEGAVDAPVARAGPCTAVVEAGVAEAVADDAVALPQQAGQDADVCRVSRRKDECRLAAAEGAHRLLQLDQDRLLPPRSCALGVP
jgi:hypothetical protein